LERVFERGVEEVGEVMAAGQLVIPDAPVDLGFFADGATIGIDN
jgi:hypothetical protein